MAEQKLHIKSPCLFPPSEVTTDNIVYVLNLLKLHSVFIKIFKIPKYDSVYM